MTKEKETTLGKIHPKRTMFFRVHVGTAKNSQGSYEMATNAGDSAPIVESKKTGKWFTLSWEDIMNMAKDADIDKKDKVKK